MQGPPAGLACPPFGNFSERPEDELKIQAAYGFAEKATPVMSDYHGDLNTKVMNTASTRVFGQESEAPVMGQEVHQMEGVREHVSSFLKTGMEPGKQFKTLEPSAPLLVGFRDDLC